MKKEWDINAQLLLSFSEPKKRLKIVSDWSQDILVADQIKAYYKVRVFLFQIDTVVKIPLELFW